MSTEHLSLADLGWSAHFTSQIPLEDYGRLPPARISRVDRDRILALSEAGEIALGFPPGLTAGAVAVGDWVLTDLDRGRIARRLDPRSELARRAAGSDGTPQLIAANVDTLFLVTSCNEEYNLARTERYLALALDAGCTPVVVLTKADLAGNAPDLAAEIRAISRRIADVVPLDARDPDAIDPLLPWLGRGQTVAFTGSSGVGKSTLIATLSGRALATAGIREDDAKGRHTTTARSLYPLAGGALAIDLPGMRELGLLDAAGGIAELFDDIEDLAGACRFRDCGHDSEPGCAVRAAVEEGRLDEDRVARWRKLRLEDARNSEAAHEHRQRMKVFGRMVKEAKSLKKRT